jgi:hypothetical protein
LATAKEIGEPNRIVTVSAWPLAAIGALEDWQWFDDEARRLVWKIAEERHPVRRCDALFCVLRVSMDHEIPAPHLVPVLDAFIEACRVCHGWKRDRNLRDMAVRWHLVDRQRARTCIALIESPRVRRQTERRLVE